MPFFLRRRTIHGHVWLQTRCEAWVNKAKIDKFTFDSPPTPTNISSKLEPEANRKGTPASPATARASIVLPVPGGPVRRTPLGSLPPRLENFSGFLRNSTTSSSSYTCEWQVSFALRLDRSGVAYTLGLLDTVDIAELDDFPFFRLKLYRARSSFKQSSIFHNH